MAEDQEKLRAPLADRMRPLSFDDIIGQSSLVGKAGTLRALVKSNRLGSIILWGPPGTGKTSLAKVLAKESGRDFKMLSAVNASVKDVREIVRGAEELQKSDSKATILLLDEIHRFSKSQQDSLLPAVESGIITLVGATTENPYFSVNNALLSRASLFELKSLTVGELELVITKGLSLEGKGADRDAIKLVAEASGGDARNALTTLDLLIALADGKGSSKITKNDVIKAENLRVVRYDKSAHYDIISAFIKSIRGSDVDSGLYWLARMLKAGEDPRFIARRLVILASEDIGVADPTALLVATAGAQAVEFVGLPEAQINLSQVVIHLAKAPKSNSAYMAINAANAEVESSGELPVPRHLKDAHYPGAEKLGIGQEYKYPHDYENGHVEQQYRPKRIENNKYYHPTKRGRDK